MADSAIHSINYGSDNYTFTLPYGVCNTTAETVAKTVTVQNFSLEPGARIIIKFTYANSATKPTLNVNGTGAKSIMRYGTTNVSTGTTTTGWIAGAIQAFTYDGTNWVQDYWNNTTYSNAALGQGYATCATAAATAAKVGSLSSYKLVTGGIVSVKFTYAVPASATLNINSTGAKNIYYRGAAITADVIKAGDIATFIYSSQYHLISIDRWQNDIAGLQTQLDSKQETISGGASTITSSNLTTNRALISNGSGKVAVSAVTSTELGYLGGVTSNVQTQLDEIKNTKPDWNQMDETAPDYVKNRTHYYNVVEAPILEEITIELSDDTDGLATISSGVDSITVGKVYKVIWDSAEYLCTSYSFLSTSNIGIGNLYHYSNVQSDTSEPFFILAQPGSKIYTVYDRNSYDWSYDGSVFTHTLSISEYSENIKQLPEQVIPYEIPRMKDIPHTEGSGEVLFDGSFRQRSTLNSSTSIVLSSVPICGKRYTVTYDGTSYECVAYFDGEYLTLGANYDSTTNSMNYTNFPFAIYDNRGNNTTDSYAAQASVQGNHTLTIKEEVVHKLDEKYLPESVDEVIIRSSTEGSTKKFKLTVDDSGTITATEV